jgi:hypothetical protein
MLNYILNYLGIEFDELNNEICLLQREQKEVTEFIGKIGDKLKEIENKVKR